MTVLPENVEAILAPLPPASPFRAALAALVSSEPGAVERARQALKPFARAYWEEPQRVEEEEALLTLRATLALEFPEASRAWEEHRAETVLFVLIGSAHPSLVELVAERYAEAPPELGCTLLTLVASAGTRRGAEVLVGLLKERGWPRPMYQRFLTELARNLPHADALFPDLLEIPGGPFIELADVALRALRGGTLPPGHLETSDQVRELGIRLATLLERHAVLRGRAAESLSDAERSVSPTLAVLLDLAGFVGGPGVLPPLRAAARLPDAWPAMFAIVSLLRRGEPISGDAIARVAADASVRATLWSLLQPLDACHLVPAELRSRDAFAEADMVGWLAHPNELGRAPDALERMAVFSGKLEDEDLVLYVWRFRADEDTWKAAISGPYPVNPAEGPLHGTATFSRFDPWDAHDAAGHAAEALATLRDWSRMDE